MYERIADFVGDPGSKFSERGQAFRTRHLGEGVVGELHDD
jgi:hypothetical protein